MSVAVVEEMNTDRVALVAVDTMVLRWLTLARLVWTDALRCVLLSDSGRDGASAAKTFKKLVLHGLLVCTVTAVTEKFQ